MGFIDETQLDPIGSGSIIDESQLDPIQPGSQEPSSKTFAQEHPFLSGVFRAPLLFGSQVADVVSYPFRKGYEAVSGEKLPGTFTEVMTLPALEKLGLEEIPDNQPGSNWQTAAEWATPVVPAKPAAAALQGLLAAAGAVGGKEVGGSWGETIGGTILPFITSPFKALTKGASSESKAANLTKSLSKNESDFIAKPGGVTLPEAIETVRNETSVFSNPKEILDSPSPFTAIEGKVAAEQTAAREAISSTLEQKPSLSIDDIDPEKILKESSGASGGESSAVAAVAKKEKTKLELDALVAETGDKGTAREMLDQRDTLTRAVSKNKQPLSSVHPAAAQILDPKSFTDYQDLLTTYKTLRKKAYAAKIAGKKFKDADKLKELESQVLAKANEVDDLAKSKIGEIQSVIDNAVVSPSSLWEMRKSVDRLARWESRSNGAAASAYRNLRIAYQKKILEIAPELEDSFTKYQALERVKKNVSGIASTERNVPKESSAKWREALRIRAALPRILGGSGMGIFSPNALLDISPKAKTRADLLKRGLGQTLSQKIGASQPAQSIKDYSYLANAITKPLAQQQQSALIPESQMAEDFPTFDDIPMTETPKQPPTAPEKAAGLDLDALKKAIVTQESSGKADVVSDKGAVGRMQLLPATAKEMADELGLKDYDLKDPDTNEMLGMYYLDKLMTQFKGNVELALTAYHSGPGRVEKLLKKTGGSTLSDIIKYLGPVGQKYAKQVMARYNKLSGRVLEV